MPLLKRIEKRISRKEKEDELGITDLKRKMKEMKEDGADGVDSGSDSDSNSDSDDSDSSDDDGHDSLSDEDSSSDGDDDEEQDGGAIEEGDESEEDAEEEESVLEDPIYSLAEEEETEALPADDASEGEEPAVPDGPMGCMLCPNKMLKNEKMVEVHLASKPHKRSAARFAKKISDPSFDRTQVIDPRDIAIQIEEEIRSGSGAAAKSSEVSNTATKKRKKQESTMPSKTGEKSEASAEGQAKPKRERAWKVAKREAKKRRMDAKETGKPPRKEAERRIKAKESSGENAPSETKAKDEVKGISIQLPMQPYDDAYSTDDSLDDDALLDDADSHRHSVTEAGLNRWSRFPAEELRASLDGPKNNPKILPLGNTTVPVIDEVQAWLKRNNSLPADKGPYKPKGRRSTPQDAEANYEIAAKALELDIPLWNDDDRPFYDRWAPTVDFTWTYDFADLRLRRARKGWKWRLVRIRPNGEVIVQPFIKPSQKPFAERGLNSSDVMHPTTSAAKLLDQIAKQAEYRWRGMPITKGEEEEDEKRLRHLIFVEGLKNHYGFMGEIISQSSAEMGSSVYVLVILALAIYTVLFIFGPPAATPYLSEFLVALLPLQSSVRGIVAMAADMKRKPGDKYTEGGNARQWLLYWVVYQLFGMMQGWVAIVRPGWYKIVCGWRTVILALCASPLFGSFALHPEEKKTQRRRLLKIIWQERGQKMADEAILREIPKPDKNFNPTGRGPAKGSSSNHMRFSQLWYAEKLLLEARQFLGWHQEYYKGGYNTNQSRLGKVKAPSSSMRKAIVKLEKYVAEMKNTKSAPKDGPGFEACCRELESHIAKTCGFARTNEGSQSFAWLLKDKYGVSDDIAQNFLNTLFWENGIDNAQRSGIRQAQTDSAFRREWKKLGAAPTNFWDADYFPSKQAPMPNINEKCKAFLRGDPAVVNEFNSPDFQRGWREKLRQTGRPWDPQADKDNGHNLPWTGQYVPNHQNHEDVSGLVKAEKIVPGSGLLQRGTQPDYNFLYAAEKK
ncbi:hypothetical protein NCC49_003449 [Naganishia albida]|nr:hypothetical protein NCC49_003449 [Naganishia albida]